MKLITHAAWGARYGKGPTNITPSGGVAVHYVGVGRLATIPHSKCAARVRSIESQHVGGNGWAAIAYNFLVCHHGYVFEGRGLGHRSAAQGTNSGNQYWYAVCALVGDGDTIIPPALLAAVRDAIDYMRARGAGRGIKGHRDFHSTSCPGGPLYVWVRKGAPRPSKQEDDMPFTEAQLRKIVREEAEKVMTADAVPAPGSNPADGFDPDGNPGFDPAKNPTWGRDSVRKQTIQGLIVVDKKVDQLAADVRAELAEVKALLAAKED
ncbi:MAG TPA: peptidoglycan recognition family protein [Streptosporangiaceae bacterium]|nr:peptidoglycan recognition family protein [Streptosporangiaceae bacterium]